MLRSTHYLSRQLLRSIADPRRIALAVMSTSRSPSPPSKRTKLDDQHEQQIPTSIISHAIPAGTLNGENGSNSDNTHDASMLPIPEASTSKVQLIATKSTNGQSQSASKVKKAHKKKNKKRKPVDSGGLEDTMFHEAIRLLGRDKVNAIVEAEQDYDDKFEHLQEVELEIVDMSSHGEWQTSKAQIQGKRNSADPIRQSFSRRGACYDGGQRLDCRRSLLCTWREGASQSL